MGITTAKGLDTQMSTFQIDKDDELPSVTGSVTVNYGASGGPLTVELLP